ncbi:MAG: leucine-rich repeat protein [Clostridiales bacterium]|nr:leucine-rich repeat protein [Clostridiales bacterium]
MHFKLSRCRKVLLSICTCVLLLALSLSIILLVVENGNPFVSKAVKLEEYRQQLTYLNENYDNENRIVVISTRNIKDENAIASAYGFGNTYVFQYATNAEAQSALNYYNSLKYASAMMSSTVTTQVDVADGDETVVLDHLSWGADILGVDSYQKAIEQKYNSNPLPDVYVAVLDTGIDTDNEFLQDRIALEYGVSVYDSSLYLNGNSPYKFEDDHMHGTHVAGTIVDLTLPNVKIIPIKILDGNGIGDIEDIVFGVNYVMYLKETVGLNVVAMNMSLAADSLGNESTVVFDQAYAKNIMSVVAAGNDSYYVEEYFPANCPSALTVSALSQNAVYENFPFVAYYSNYGSSVDLCLPGSNVLSCVPDGYNYSKDYIFSTTGGTYAYLSGTSMATPHASALVALYATYMGNSFNTARVEKLLKQNAYDLGATGRDNLFGYGVPSMDLALADRELTKTPTLTVGEVGKPYHFDGTISVGITNNNAAYKDMTYEIYYTLDGSYPMICGNSQEYSVAITLNGSTHLSFVIYLFDSDGFVRGHSQLYEIEFFNGEDVDKNTKGIGFEINGNGILQKYTSGIQDVVIPEYVNGIKVRELGNNLFYGLNVRSIVCEADVSLANKASVNLEYPIRYCPNLQSVTLGSSDATYAVSHCFNLKELILLNAKGISDATFPSFTLGYSYLGSYTAYGCAALERVVAYKATSVGTYAFNYVKTLKELVLPNVNSIFSCAFIECTGLTEVDLPSAMYIYGSAFKDCYNLRTVRTPKLATIDSYAFANCISLTDIQTETATKYGTGAFYNCIGLTTLDTQSALTIEGGAFEKCRNLMLLDLSSVTSIGENTMPNCDNLIAIYCGTNKYLIDKSVTWADWIVRFGNLQYLVTDFSHTTRGGLLNNRFFDSKVIDNKYRVFTRTELFTAIFKDENGNEIAKRYHVAVDPLNPPTGVVNDEYQINYLKWKSESTGDTFTVGDKIYLSADDTFTLVDYNAYYFAYAEQAKAHYAELYQKLTGRTPAANDAVYSAIELACTVNRVGAQTSDTVDRASILKKVNGVIDSAICNLLDNLLLDTDSNAVVEIVRNAKSDVSAACGNAPDVVDLNEIIDNALNAIAAQRLQDLESAKDDAKKALRDRTKDIYEKLYDERKAEADELYEIYDSKIDAADQTEYESIIDECSREFIIQDGLWTLDDLVSDSEDDGILEIVNGAKEDVRSLADSDLSDDELHAEVNAIVEQAKKDIEEYLSSKGTPVDPEEPDDGNDPDDGKEEPPIVDPDESDNGGNSENDPNGDNEPSDEGDNTVAVAVGVTTGVVGVGALGGVVFWLIRRRRRG